MVLCFSLVRFSCTVAGIEWAEMDLTRDVFWPIRKLESSKEGLQLLVTGLRLDKKGSESKMGQKKRNKS